MAKTKNDSIVIERIEKIREHISGLEEAKDQIIEYYENNRDLDESRKNIWTADVKECYYNVVASFQMLPSGAKGGEDQEKLLDSSKTFLQGAENRLTQVVSELTGLADQESQRLSRELEASFSRCCLALSAELERFSAGKKIEKPKANVYKVSDSEYHIPCSVCGDIAVKFKIGRGKYDKQDGLVFSGITHGTSLNKGLAPELFKCLEKESLGAVHSFMKKHRKREGLDAYCPKCRKVYCKSHYQTREEYDDGFYDCTYGTCPKGHRRILHD